MGTRSRTRIAERLLTKTNSLLRFDFNLTVAAGFVKPPEHRSPLLSWPASLPSGTSIGEANNKGE